MYRSLRRKESPNFSNRIQLVESWYQNESNEEINFTIEADNNVEIER